MSSWCAILSFVFLYVILVRRIMPAAEMQAATRYAVSWWSLRYGKNAAPETSAAGIAPTIARTIELIPKSFVLSTPSGVMENASAPIGISKAVYVTSSMTNRTVV